MNDGADSHRKNLEGKVVLRRCAATGTFCRVTTMGTLQVAFPFHARPAETVQDGAIRRARFLDVGTNTWNLIKPFQAWPLGEVRAARHCCAPCTVFSEHCSRISEHPTLALVSAVLRQHLVAAQDRTWCRWSTPCSLTS